MTVTTAEAARGNVVVERYHAPLPGSYVVALTLQARTLNSGILACGSRAGLVSRFAGASQKRKGTKTTPSATRPVTHAGVVMQPRLVRTVTSPPSGYAEPLCVGRVDLHEAAGDELVEAVAEPRHGSGG